MLSELDNLSRELQTEKVLIRQKAFSRLYDILNGRSEEFKRVLEQSNELTWEDLFVAIFNGIRVHSQKLLVSGTELQENDTRITNYSKVILKLCDSPGKFSKIPGSVLISKANEALTDNAILKYFGRCFVQLLQRSAVKVNSNLTDVSLIEWIDLLHNLFKLLQTKRHNILFLDILYCTKQALEQGTAFSHVASSLHKYLPQLVALLGKRTDDREKLELLTIAYLCIRNIVVDYRFEVCRFTEAIAKYIHQIFKVDLNEESKHVLFKLMDLAIIVHYPSLEHREQLEFINDKKVWYQQLRNFVYIIQLELKLAPKAAYRSVSKPEVNQIFAQFAARLCFLVYWDYAIWEENFEHEEENPPKRIRRSRKLQALMDFTQTSSDKFNWKWLNVLAEVLYNYDSALCSEDVPGLMDMLAQCQGSIEHEVQVYSFARCCFVLLQREQQTLPSLNPIVLQRCNELWHKIADGSIRVCSSNNKHSKENHILLQILLHHNKHSSFSFIEDVIKLFISKATIKSDTTLQTLITLMTRFNIDLLQNSKELIKKLLTYIFEKETLASSNLRQLIKTSSHDKISPHIISSVGVLCCLSKSDVVKYCKSCILNEYQLFESNWKLQEQTVYKKETSEMSKLLLLKCNELLLLEDQDFDCQQEISMKKQCNIEFPIEIKCIVDQRIYEEEFQHSIEFKGSMNSDASIEVLKEYLQQVLENNEIMMSLANNFLAFEAFNEDKFNSSFVIKKIHFHMQEIEQLFELLLTKSEGLSLRDVHQLLNLVKSLFDSNYHAKIGQKVRTFELKSCLQWLSHQVNHLFRCHERDDDFEKMKIGWIDFINAKMEDKIKFMAVETLCLYNNFDGINKDTMVELLDDIELDIVDNMDLHTIFHVLKLFGSQNAVPEEAVQWIWKHIMQICQHHHNNQYVSGQIIENLQHIAHLSKDYELLSANVASIFTSFGKICAKPAYKPSITIEFLNQFKYFHKTYFDLFIDNKSVVEMYDFIHTNFLESTQFGVKMATIKTISYILYSDIEQDNLLSDRKSIKIIADKIFKKQCIVYNGPITMETDKYFDDEQNNQISCFLQLYTSVFCVNSMLRKPIILEISKLILKYNITEDVSLRMFNKMLNFLKCAATSLMDSNSIVDLSSHWIKNGYGINTFPWYFCGCDSFNNFIRENYQLITLAILKNRCRNIDAFSAMLEMTPKQSISELLPNCFSFLLPIEAGCDNIKYEAKADEMKVKINSHYSENEQKSLVLRHMPAIISDLLGNLYDHEIFKTLCNFDFETHENDEMLGSENFNKCLRHLKKSYANTGDQTILTFFCDNPSMRHYIEKLITMQKSKIQSTSLKHHKLQHLLQYCILVEKVLDYLKNTSISPETSIKGFLVRDITNFLCFLMQEECYGNRLRETAASFLSKFLKEILPTCADDIKPFLNKITGALVAVFKKMQLGRKSRLEEQCLAIIQFLIVEQQEALDDEIVNLDELPDCKQFRELREKQLAIKYRNREFTLIQEIEHFLKIKKRKLEGLETLRRILALKKIELKSLFDELQDSKSFGLEGEKSLLHHLIRTLIEYARSGVDDEKRSVEAVKCLGEIGINDLKTMVFTTESLQNVKTYRKIENVAQCQENVCALALDQMETMILHHNPIIFEVASHACYHMLESVSSKNYKYSAYLRIYNTNSIGSKYLFYETPKQNKQLDFIKLLREEEYSTYKTWIKRITGSMLFFVGDKVLGKVSNTQKSFAELLCPLMMQLLLNYDNEAINNDVCEGINHFFRESSEKLNYSKVNEGSIYLNKMAIRQMLQLVEVLRMHCQDHQKSYLSRTMKLHYLNIARSSKHCEAFFTAVLYCEKWAEQQKLTESQPYATSLNNKVLQEVMFTAYTAIGINDISELFVNPITNRPLYLQVCNQSWQNILEHDSGSHNVDYSNVLNSLGLHRLAQNLDSVNQNGKTRNFEFLWRLTNWDILVEADSEVTEATSNDYRLQFEKYHYSALKCLKSGDEFGQKITTFKARKAVLHMIQHESLETTQNLYKFMGMAHMLQQVEDFAEIRFQTTGSESKLLDKWNAQNQLPHDFNLFEPILTQRNSIFDTANIKAGRRRWIPQALEDNMLFIVKESISSECKSVAIKTLAKMRLLPNLSPTTKAEMLIQEAQLNFDTNMNLSKHCLKRVINDKEFVKEFMLKSTALRLYGEILAESHADDITTINAEYFKRSISYLESYAKHNKKSYLVANVDKTELSQDVSQPQQLDSEDVVSKQIKNNICVFDVVAKYFDREYISKSEYIASPDFQNKLKAITRNKKILEEIIKRVSKEPDLRKTYVIYKRNLEIDETEIKTAEKQMKAAAGNAIFHYIRGAMNDSGDNVLSIFRIVSIWMANFERKVVKSMIQEAVTKIPSYKFIVALPQLTVRLSDRKDDEGNQILKSLLNRCAMDHPHHTMPFILALVNSYADSDNTNKTEEPRVVGAKDLWESLNNNPRIPSVLIQEMEIISSAFIHLANLDTKQMPQNHKLMALRNMSHTQCHTLELPVMKDCNYQNSLISIVGWKKRFEEVGGINAPKKITCVCSDGIKRPQLLKGKDDMRQDAVMQQVFSVVNQMLMKNKESNKRHARVRTYKVVPLARCSGILEWCNNTIPIGTYLKSAHERYYPNDMKPQECFLEVTNFDKLTDEGRREKFLNICDKIHPVFHNFFYENYKSPGQLFERRLAYTNSVAVSSMVGYVLGIGDRHVQNILIDYNTAEICHIDFGVAFEQGKILPHKEMIPFRLTRDMVAPFGVCEVDGIFRKACETTMKILRQNDKTLTTILEVLLYDPLYSWTLSPSKARQRQFRDFPEDASGDETNQVEKDSMAIRALLRLQAKLKGQADDSSGYSSVEGQVNCLIQKAMNPALLCQLFRGWQAYL